MTVFEAIILGIVEGITEYLPVSSTGHLIVTQYLLGMKSSVALDAFSVSIQGGAILAVLGVYFARIKQMCAGLVGRDTQGRRMLINVILGFIPSAVIGLILYDFIKGYLFNATTVAYAWLIGGIAILLFTRWRHHQLQKHAAEQGELAEQSDQSALSESEQGKSLEELTWKQALGVGFMQCLAMCPGVSRSFSTMLGGMLVGLSLTAAVEFSFLLGLVTLSAATVLDAWQHGEAMVRELGWTAILVGAGVAWLSALVAVRWLLAYLQKHSLNIFGWYRIAAAIFMFILILRGADLPF